MGEGMVPTNIQAFASTQLTLLSQELAAELAETAELTSQSSLSALQRAGVAVLNLQIASQRTGLGGKTLLELELDHAVKNGVGTLPEHGIRVGDIVGVREQHGGAAKKKERAEMEKSGVNGVVVKSGNASISVALGKEDFQIPLGKLWIVKLANDVTYKRMKQTMTRLQKYSESEYTPFIRTLFGLSSPTPVFSAAQALRDIPGDVSWFNDSLNESQQEAVIFALASKEVALIHGPPGTGKTQTLIEVILQFLKRGLRLLVCGPSNISVDNIVERLAPHKVNMVRLGHPARLLPSVLNHSLEVLTKTSDAAALVQEIRKEMDEKQASIRKTRSGREKKAIYDELRDLRKEYRQREKGCVNSLVRTSKVVLATLHGAGSHQLDHAEFDVVIIDEASQALEAQCWVALLSARKAVLAGDHLQLPPTIKSINARSQKSLLKVQDNERKENEASKEVSGQHALLEVTLFDRLLALHGPSIKRMLTTQYRMHEKIMDFPSRELYNSELKAADAVKKRLLMHLPNVSETDDTREPLVFYDTQGGEFLEQAEDSEVGGKAVRGMSLWESKSNSMEAKVIKLHVQKLFEAGLRPAEIAVITPYNAQLALLSQPLKEKYPGIELGSVDGFQGREKEAVIVSLVRSNLSREVGFLGEKRRLNVAMTRPKRHLCVIGDSETMGSGNEYLKSWMQFLEEHADLRYPDPGDLYD